MYRAFKIPDIKFQDDISSSEVAYKEQAKEFKSLLESASNNGRLDGTAIRDRWFPQQDKAQVFISHSHRDINEAVKLANWLESNLGIKAFIDSAVWLYADDLLRSIDNDYCYQESNNTYSYEKRNGTTAHVHMMLATALGYMLDSCECAFFLDTPNSVSKADAVATTGSPWIMYEITLMSLIRPKPPTRQINFSGKILNEHRKMASATLQIDYNLDLSALPTLRNEDLNSWSEGCAALIRGDRALDKLYEDHQ